VRKQRAVFVDRDGVINVDKGYVHKVEDLEILDGVVEAIRLLKTEGFEIIVVTNQSGVARGFYREHEVRDFHEEMQRILAKDDAALDAYYYCPHHPEGSVTEYRRTCACRKPAPGMVQQAIEDFNLDPAVCYVVGDEMRDLEAGRCAGCRAGFLVSGSDKDGVDVQGDWEITTVPGFLGAAREIIGRENRL
jgi:D-glycero-D-manno-heptose 1,7-bisphosphate phosphatase